MNKSINVFKRTEKKYLVHEDTFCLFLNEISPYIKSDAYGKYSICNIYFDTNCDRLIQNSIEKPIYKEKMRLRSYGIPSANSTVFLELKKKYKGTVFKRRISLPLNIALAYLNNGIRPDMENQILNEIDYFIKMYSPVPKIFIGYEREAYSAMDDDSLRITVDSNIRSRDFNLSLYAGDYGEALLPENMRLIEIKTVSAYPMWLTSALSKYKMFPASFSKYGNIYKKNLPQKRTSKDTSFFKLKEVI